MKLITAWDTRTGICVVTKETGVRKEKHIDFSDWYFYILLEDYDKAKPVLDKYYDAGLVKKIQPGKKYVRVLCFRIVREEPSIDSLRYDLLNLNVEVFEFDLTKSKRYMIDNNIEIEDDMRVLYFDIETDDSKGGIEIGRDRIISFAACDDKKTYFKTGEEKKILQAFVNLIKRYDVITGWNSEGFDLPYIQMRCEKYGIKYNWRSIIHVDLMQRCFKLYAFQMALIGLKNFHLNEVARCFLNSAKTDLGGVKINVLERENPELLKKYNINDAVLLLRLDKKLNIIPLMVKECCMTGSFMNKFYIGELLDNYILREAKAEQLILQSRPSDIEYEKLADVNVTGGYVAEPKTGLYNHVHICDFKSLYPSIIIGWNIGIDALNKTLTVEGTKAMATFLGLRKIEEIDYETWKTFLQAEKIRLDPNNEFLQTCNNAFFSREKQSFYSKLVEGLLNLRKEYKKKLKGLTVNTPEYINHHSAEMVIKEMANSMFGITCDKRSRYFNKPVSEGITYTGQYLNKCSAWLATQDKLTPIYGDTDSIFITGTEDFNEEIVKINTDLSKLLETDFKVFKNVVSLEYEKKYRRLLLLEKKRYTGLLSIKDGKEIDLIHSRGTEDIKKSNAIIGRRIFTEFTNKILRTDVTSDEARKYVVDLKEHIFKDNLSVEDLTLINKISKRLEDYKTLSLHGRLAKRLIAEGKLLPIVENRKGYGTRLEYVIVDVNGKREGVLADEFAGECDRIYYWNVQIYAPIQRVLECVWPAQDWGLYLGPISKQITLFA
jgi:DNA polymerase elongation subunit (family B)